MYLKEEEENRKEAVIFFEDGTSIAGKGFGAVKKVQGEIVFNTGMVGYTESITDPSYKGQILIQTYPLIGNYGVSPSHFESDGPKIEGYVVRELCRNPSHWSSKMSLNDWLNDNGIPGIESVDTRMLTKKIREKGTMLGILCVYNEGEEPKLKKLGTEAKRIPDPNKRDLAYEVATKSNKRHDIGGKYDIVLVDCGTKLSILKNITERGFNVIQVPPITSAREILGMKPIAIIISNGPGNPKICKEVIETTKNLIEEGLPILGICLGCQIIALSMGCETYKLKFGHRGQNHPCVDTKTNRCYITSQNHGYAIENDSINRDEFEVAFLNANDNTVEGVRHKSLNLMGIQFHPEASPGPNDVNFIFDNFFKNLIQKR